MMPWTVWPMQPEESSDLQVGPVAPGPLDSPVLPREIMERIGLEPQKEGPIRR
jgi:hypothetical protein